MRPASTVDRMAMWERTQSGGLVDMEQVWSIEVAARKEQHPRNAVTYVSAKTVGGAQTALAAVEPAKADPLMVELEDYLRGIGPFPDLTALIEPPEFMASIYDD